MEPFYLSYLIRALRSRFSRISIKNTEVIKPQFKSIMLIKILFSISFSDVIRFRQLIIRLLNKCIRMFEL